jgi:Asp-tRNA(Asn)/Glu-tRNA(Gln) amidotransferase A subunit family amidase
VKTKSSPFGLGSDSAGSIRIPASFCGNFSFKASGSRRLSRLGRITVSGD